MQKDDIRTFCNTIHKRKLKWIKDLNVRLDTIKLVDEDTGRKLFDINHSRIFFGPPASIYFYMLPKSSLQVKRMKIETGSNLQ